MKGRAKAVLLTSTVQDARTIRDRIRSRLDANPAWEEDVVAAAVSYKPAQPAAVVACRFDTRAQAEAFRDWMRNLWTAGVDAGRILAGSRIELHRCRHDEAVNDCTELLIEAK